MQHSFQIFKHVTYCSTNFIFLKLKLKLNKSKREEKKITGIMEADLFFFSSPKYNKPLSGAFQLCEHATYYHYSCEHHKPEIQNNIKKKTIQY